ncbi:AMP-binding protein [Streptomyces adustus]|nr:AMP-binding protein [Streptomyces adustus]
MTDAAHPYDRLLDSLRGAAPWATGRTDPAPQTVHGPQDDAATEGESVGALIARRCASSPEAVALHTDDGDLTYAELGARADATAAALLRAGIGKGEIVALVFERSAEFVVAVLAVWRAGAACLPLSPGRPEAWLAEAAHRAKASLVLGRPILGHPSLPDMTEHADPVRDVNAPGDLAYGIATSGSTGTPKLVVIEHRGLTHLARAQRAFCGPLPSHTRVLLFAHPAFDAALSDIVPTLTNGVRLDVPDVPAQSGEPLTIVLTDRRTTHAVLPAAVLRPLTPGGFPDLEVLISIGDVW